MSAQQLHLIVAHLPVIGLPVTLFVYAFALRWRDDRLQRLCWLLVVAFAASSAVSYFSGPDAFEMLDQAGKVDEATRAIAEEHALLGRIAFSAMALLGGACGVAFFGRLQGAPPGRSLRLGIAIVGWLIVLLLAWTAHEGGELRHVELRHGEYAES
ncbi:MAG: hypothetical protein MK209_07315 [Planctomycetes bacterium]|nr:hypothetical protein [Planctomycetota bacterium]